MGISRMCARTIAVIVIAAGCLAAAPETALAVPGTPGSLSASASNPPVLSWDRATSAVKYEVQVDDDPAFVSPEFTLTTVNTRAVPTLVLHAGDQFWRVRAYDATNVVGAWAQASFVVDPVPAPTGLTPHATTLQQPSSPPLLSWDEVRGAEAYVVQLDDEEDTEYVGAREYTTKATALVVPEALPTGDTGESYRWRVKAIRDSGVESDFSGDATFTLSPIAAVTLNTPADDAVVQDIVLDWQPLPGAQYYELEVSTDDSFSTSTLVEPRRKVYGTRYSPSITYDNNTYYWRVRAVDTSGNPSAWSDGIDLRSFVRSWTLKPAQQWPAPGANVPANRMFLEWTPVQHATQYEVQMGSDQNFSPGTFSACHVAGTTYTPGIVEVNTTTAIVMRDPHEKCTPQAGVPTYWRVRALDLPFTRPGTGTSGVQGLFSDTRSFVFNPDALGTMTPANGATVDVPVLSWSPVDNAAHYEVSLSDNTGNPVVAKTRTYATSYVPIVSTPLTAAKSPYTWRLQAIGADGVTQSLIAQRTFSISGEAPDEGPWAGAASPLTPLTANDPGSSSMRAPLMAWEPHPGAASYRVFAGPAGSGTLFGDTADAFNVKLSHPAVTDIWTRLLEPGQYDWFVEAYDATGVPIATGPVATFAIAPIGSVGEVQVALDGTELAPPFAGSTCVVASPCDNTIATPVISWNPVPSASMYLVYVSEESDFTNVVEPLISLPATTNTIYAPTLSQEKAALAESLAGASYYVFIRPCRTVTSCGPNPVSASGMATTAFEKKSPRAVLEQPVPGATVSTSEITFDWQDYRATNAATIFADTGEAGTQSAKWYRIQVDDNANFSSPIESVRVDQSTYTSPTTLYPEGPLYWRVQAIDADDNDLAWSDGRVFTKSSPVVALTSPLHGTVRHGTTVFRWQPRAFAASYDIELYKNNDTTFSSANRVFSKNVKQTAYVWNEVIPSSTVPYVWRVRAVDPLGNKGPWSTTRAFTNSTEEPHVEGPASGSYLQGDDILLRWTSVPGATSYEVELMAPTGTTAERTDTKATAYAPYRTLVDGTWQWKVVAENASGTQIGSSGWATFVIDENGPKVMTVAPSTVLPRSSIVVTFNEPVKNVTGRTLYLKKNGTRRKVAAAVTLSADKLRATLNPSRRLGGSTVYTLKLTAGITDLRDNKLAPTTRSIFVR
ncbi:Ig-like domain-containing protein [Nocardioides bizhenqiangii]|uniref:Ig-like domain-containing protein n=1 Tax=Nocardioides bizhenqiangii TaxID=3095076 RepID=A0ABZ0ZMS4_9ACTN|nr:Ig-like domain-containing protein [Nocardioides sp. HM61]WQQ25079.1 Ig-like domain-containing protein [Nocardioides sp. HM61]